VIAFAPILALFGAIVGSFVGAAVLRMSAGRGIVMGRSSCDSCDVALGPAELIPILSYVWQGGRCRHCSVPIAIDQPIAEIACTLVGALAAVSTDDLAGAVVLALFGWTLVALALLDVRHHWLPDVLTLPLVITGVVLAFAMPDSRPIERIAGAGVGYVLLESLRWLYRSIRHRDGLGGGDPKLLAAIGAWLGIEALPWVILIAGLLGIGVVTLRRVRGDEISRYDRLPLGTLLAAAAIGLMPIARWIG
jgi:leader peptidase (prepilin peptidase)/N-methyltransferase